MARYDDCGRKGDIISQFSESISYAANHLLDCGYLPIPLFAGRKQMDLNAMGFPPLQLEPRSKRMKHVLFEGVLVGIALGAIKQEEPGQWFDKHEVNLGIVTGVSGLVGLDFDSHEHYFRFRDRNQAFAESAPTAFSPRGVHVYFRTSQNHVCSSLYMGMRHCGHIKALGGYLVCAPSVLPGKGAYRWKEGRSLTQCCMPETNLDDLGISQVSPIKSLYDTMLGRGGFQDG